MSYVPNAAQTSEPVASRAVESAALEFRTLKGAVVEGFASIDADYAAEEAARIAADLALGARITSVEGALFSAGTGGLPGVIYITRFSGTGSQVAFTLPVTPPTQSNVDAYIQGVYQHHDTFSVTGSVITFTTAPLTGTNNIEIRLVVPQTEVPSGDTYLTLNGLQIATNKTIDLGSNTLIGTKAQFDAACSDADFASLAGVEVFTNKTLTSPALNNPTITNYTETVNAPAAGSVFTVALASGTIHRFTTNANASVTLPASVAGKNYTVIIAYGGVHTLTWAGGSTLKWHGGAAPTPTSVNGKFDIFVFTCDGTNTYGRSGGSNF